MTDYAVSTEFRGTDKLSHVLVAMGKSVGEFATKAKSKLSGIDFGGKLERAEKGLGKLKSGFNSLAVPALAVGASATLIGKSIWDSGAQFEQTLANINAVAKPTQAELGRLGDEALNVGASFGFSASDVASSMEAMVKQGLSVEQVIAGIGGVASAAAADGSSMEETMAGLLATMAGMGKGAGDLQHIADLMAKAGDKTAASIGTLSQSMAVFGPTAKALGIPIEDAIGQLALLQDAGIDASSAGTTLAAVYSKLAAPAGKTVHALKTLGLSVKDSYGNMKPPEQLLGEILSATDKIEGNVGKAAAVTQLVGLESQKALLNITAAVKTGKYSEVMGDLKEGVDGYAEAIGRLKMNSAAGDLQKLTGYFEGLRIKIFQLESSELRALIQAGLEWAQANEEIISGKIVEFVGDLVENLPQIYQWTKRLAIGIVVFKGLEVAISGAQMVTAIYSGTMLLLGGRAAAAAVSTGALEVATAGATTKMIGFNTAALANPLTWVLGAVAAVVLLAVYWDEATEAVGRYIDKAAGWFGDKDAEKMGKKRAKALASGKLLHEEEDVVSTEELRDSGKLGGPLGKGSEFGAIFKRAKEIESQLDRGLGADGAAAPAGTPAAGAPPARVRTSEQALLDDLGYGGDPFDFGGPVVTREESRSVQQTEIVIRDETGRAEIAKPPDKGSGSTLKIKRSGAP